MNDVIVALRQLRRALAHPVVSIGLVLVGVVAAGFVTMLLGWHGSATTFFVPLQLPYVLSGGFAGLALVILGLGLFNTHSTRTIAARRQAQADVTLREAVQLLTVLPAALSQSTATRPDRNGR